MEYREIMWAEQSPIIYSKDNTDYQMPCWQGVSEENSQEKEYLDFSGEIILHPTIFSPGTRVVISVPLCPECGTEQGYHNSESCGFDWGKWIVSEYQA